MGNIGDILKTCVIVFFTMLFFSNATYALTGNPRHFIIAVDVAYSDAGYKNFIASNHTKECICTLLEKNSFNKNDYLSMVSYAISMINPDFSKFVTIATNDKGQKISWTKYNDARSAFADISDWYNVTLGHHLKQFENGSIASLQSLSKQYTLKALVSSDSTKVCDETILLMITDDVVNGIDDNYAKEIDNISFLNPKQFGVIRKVVLNYASECTKNFQFERTVLKNLSGNESSDLTLGYKSLKVVPYKVRPTERPAIQAISDIPSPLPIKRVKGGFNFKLTASTYSSTYRIHSLTLSLKAKKYITRTGKWDLFIEHENLSDGDIISLEMAVKYDDGIYNGLIISPSQPLNKQGLTLRQKFRLQQDAKIMGIIPLSDYLWWWYPNDIYNAVIVWDVILLIFFIVLICFVAYRLFRKFTRYVPKNEDIRLYKLK